MHNIVVSSCELRTMMYGKIQLSDNIINHAVESRSGK